MSIVCSIHGDLYKIIINDEPNIGGLVSLEHDIILEVKQGMTIQFIISVLSHNVYKAMHIIDLIQRIQNVKTKCLFILYYF